VEKEIEVKILEFLNAGFADLTGKVSQLNERTEQILEQTTKTNGRVTKLEEWRDQIEIKQAEESGAGAVKANAKVKRWEVLKMVLSSVVGGIMAIIFGWFKAGGK
jgi:hypothetical protein